MRLKSWFPSAKGHDRRLTCPVVVRPPVMEHRNRRSWRYSPGHLGHLGLSRQPRPGDVPDSASEPRLPSDTFEVVATRPLTFAGPETVVGIGFAPLAMYSPSP